MANLRENAILYRVYLNISTVYQGGKCSNGNTRAYELQSTPFSASKVEGKLNAFGNDPLSIHYPSPHLCHLAVKGSRPSLLTFTLIYYTKSTSNLCILLNYAISLPLLDYLQSSIRPTQIYKLHQHRSFFQLLLHNTLFTSPFSLLHEYQHHLKRPDSLSPPQFESSLFSSYQHPPAKCKPK